MESPSQDKRILNSNLKNKTVAKRELPFKPSWVWFPGFSDTLKSFLHLKGRPPRYTVPTLLSTWLRSAMSIYMASTCFHASGSSLCTCRNKEDHGVVFVSYKAPFIRNEDPRTAIPVATDVRFLPVKNYTQSYPKEQEEGFK